MAETLVNENKKKKTHSIYFWYTIFFLVVALVVFSFFVIYKKSFIWKNDGLYQHYNAFLYFGKNIRAFIKNIFQNHTFSISMWEWGFGPGNDAISYQLFYDPFFILSILTPTKYGEFGYAFSVILRLYVAGFSFCAYCKEMNCIKWTTICAAVMYTFCSYSFYAAPRHPYFVNAMLFMPLIFLGVEKILKNKTFVLFSLAVAFAAFSDFYFFYMVVLLTILYVCLRLLCDPNFRKPKVFGITIGKFLMFSLIGVLVSCILLLPTIMSFMENNTRINSGYSADLLYNLSQYSAYPGSFVSATKHATGWTSVGVAALAYIGIYGSFINRNKNNRWARIYLVSEIVFLMFPIFGRMFNGFGYVTNRWVFIWSFIPTFLFAKEFPQILNFDIKKKCALSVGCISYTVLCLVLEKSRTEEAMLGIIFLLISLIVVVFSNNIKDVIINKNGFKFFLSSNRIQQFTAALLVFCNVFSLAFYRYSKQETYYLKQFRDSGTTNSLLENESVAAWNLIDDNDFYRIDNPQEGNSQTNLPFYKHQPTTTSCWSLNSKEYIEWRYLNNAWGVTNFHFRGISSRAWLEPLYCAKYYIINDNAAAQASIPYGFDYVGTEKGYSSEYHLYKTEYSLPFGFTYENVMSRSDFEKLSIVERQQAALQSCIIDDNIQTDMGSGTLDYEDFNIEYNIESDKNIKIDNNLLQVGKAGATITISFDRKPIGELYVLISGLHCDTNAGTAEIVAMCNKAVYTALLHTEQDGYYDGQKDYLFNLGYSEEERNKITLTFSEKGNYDFKSLKVICQPMEKLPKYVKACSEDQLENVKFDTNRISGTIDLDETKFLCMSLPYSKGWTCYVDGEKTELLHANIAFSGLELQPGHHEIKLEFCTPYLKTGAILSAVGIVLIVAGGILFKNKERVIEKIQSARKHK